MIKGLKFKKWKKIIEKSGMFNSEYYLFSYPDVRVKDIDAIVHYLKNGAKEGRNPSKEFDTNYYLYNNLDVNLDKINPLVHYILHGKKEGRFTNQAKSFEYSKVLSFNNTKNITNKLSISKAILFITFSWVYSAIIFIELLPSSFKFSF